MNGAKKKTEELYNFIRTSELSMLSDSIKQEISDRNFKSHYDSVESAKFAVDCEEKFNEEQKLIYYTILSKVYPKKNYHEKAMNNINTNVFFVDALGGAGKTFLANAVINKIHGENDMVMAMAYSGIAALLLKNGQTMHSKVKVPFNIDHNKTLNINKKEMLASVIRRAKLLIIDECPIARKQHIEAIDRGLKDICNAQNKPFGGKNVLLMGDFRQILSVIPRGSHRQVVNAVLHKSYLWKNIQVFCLTENQRVKQLLKENNCDRAVELQKFAYTLKQIGDGSYPVEHEIPGTAIKLPENWLSKSETIEEFIEEIFPKITVETIDKFSKHAILTTTNKEADKINDKIMKAISPKEATIFYSTDSNMPDNKEALHSVHQLNRMNPSGAPPHALKLKRNAIIMLLRNLNVDQGACNGTRLKVIRFNRHSIEASILHGHQSGQTILIPRIKMIFEKDQTCIPFIRRQFPVKLSWCMTLSKSQGQTLDKVGLWLPRHVFGQLCVGCFRVRSAKELSIFVKDGIYQGRFPEI